SVHSQACGVAGIARRIRLDAQALAVDQLGRLRGDHVAKLDLVPIERPCDAVPERPAGIRLIDESGGVRLGRLWANVRIAGQVDERVPSRAGRLSAAWGIPLRRGGRPHEGRADVPGALVVRVHGGVRPVRSVDVDAAGITDARRGEVLSLGLEHLRDVRRASRNLPAAAETQRIDDTPVDQGLVGAYAALVLVVRVAI